MARNMNGMAIYIPNGRDNPDEPRRSPISSFGADMDTGRTTRYNADGTQENFYNNPAQQMFTQMGQLVEQGKAARKQKRSMDDAALASALIYSKQNGGFMPREMVNAVSQQLGQQIVGGNYTQDGNYVLYGTDDRVDPRTGRVIQSGGLKPIAVASPEMQYGVLSRSGLGADMLQGLYDGIQKKSGLTTDQLAAKGIVAPGARGASAAATADGKLALDAQKTALEQGNKNVAAAQKQLELLQKRRDALAERATPNDPRLAQLDNQIATYENLVGASLTGGLDQWSAALGLGGGTGAAKAPRAARQFEGEEEVKADAQVRRGGFLGMGGEKVAQVEDDTRTGAKVLNTDRSDGNGGYESVHLQDGDIHWDNDGSVYYREGGQVFRMDEGKFPVQRKQVSGGLIMSEGGNEVYLPKGKVFSFKGANYKVDGEDGSLRLVRTDEAVNWRAADAKSALEKMRADEKAKSDAEYKEKQRLDRTPIRKGGNMSEASPQAYTGADPLYTDNGLGEAVVKGVKKIHGGFKKAGEKMRDVALEGERAIRRGASMAVEGAKRSASDFKRGVSQGAANTGKTLRETNVRENYSTSEAPDVGPLVSKLKDISAEALRGGRDRAIELVKRMMEDNGAEGDTTKPAEAFLDTWLNIMSAGAHGSAKRASAKK